MGKDRKKKTQQGPDATAHGTLFVVATPIGNLEDITLRALRVLQEVDYIAAEDTRHTRKMLTHFSISTPTLSYYKEKEQVRAATIINRLRKGSSIALVSDAGTPGISDPGAILVQKAAAENITIVPVPGPSSLTAALSVAGIPESSFVFLGFAPPRRKQRQDLVLALRNEKRHLVFFEAPHRLHAFVQDCYDILGDRPVFWCRELTKMHEELTRASLRAVLVQCGDKKKRGESVLIIAGAADAPEITDAEITEILRTHQKSGTHTLKDAVQSITVEYGIPRNVVYRLALKVWGR